MGVDFARPAEIAIIGLGQIGWTVFQAFAASGCDVVGHDADAARIEALRNGFDRNNPGQRLAGDGLGRRLTSDPAWLAGATTFIIIVNTAVDGTGAADIGDLVSVCGMLAKVISRNSLVVIESTVPPGTVLGVCRTALEAGSGLRAGADFSLAYCPERINPGDTLNTFTTIPKLVSGLDDVSLERAAALYGRIPGLQIVRCPGIAVAEAAKLIENAQRDVNIAFANEMALLLDSMNIDAGQVFAVARTKWNFLPFEPGLVGGHCIGVQADYLRLAGRAAGHATPLLDAARGINAGLHDWLVAKCMALAAQRPGCTVHILGLAYKRNVADCRNSGSLSVARTLLAQGQRVCVHDPLVVMAAAEQEAGCALPVAQPHEGDAVILAVAHDVYRAGGWALVRTFLKREGGDVLDLCRMLPREGTPPHTRLWSL